LATSPRPRPGSGMSTPSRHNDHVPEITGSFTPLNVGC
jgi:hypothetical protein